MVPITAVLLWILFFRRRIRGEICACTAQSQGTSTAKVSQELILALLMEFTELKYIFTPHFHSVGFFGGFSVESESWEEALEFAGVQYIKNQSC